MKYRPTRPYAASRRFESLEPRALLAADVFISEFSASNDAVLRDTDRDYPDWVELYNAGDESADLTGWHLTDDAEDPIKWQFPQGSIAPGETLTVFASGKDYGPEESELHTNFRLSRSGEYLGLIGPDGSSVVSEVAPEYPVQFTDISYGVRMGLEDRVLVGPESPVQFLVPVDNRHGTQWRDQGFVIGDDWLDSVNGEPLTAALGFEADSGFAESINSDVGSLMRGVNASAYVRIPFQVDDPAAIGDLTLNLKYDDGIVIYMNGGVIDLRNASFFSTFNSAAQSTRDNADAIVPEAFDLTPHKASLTPGENILAIHWLNASADDVDALMSAELIAQVEGLDRSEYGYFQTPTPNARNGDEFEIGPVISDAAHTPDMPQVGEPMTVTARVEGTLHPVASVQLGYRVMYNDEISIGMSDDGQGVDAVANDGIYSAQIPANIAAPGEMVRYFVTATDETGVELRAPRITDDSGTDRSAEYYGTITQDPELTSTLPIFHWFSESVSRARSRAGARVSVYYAGEFYDNVFARQRGGATNGSSQKFNFNDDQLFYVNETVGRVAEFNMNAQGGDSTYVRQPMAFQTYTLAGNASSASFHMLMRDNATRDRVGVFIEQVDEYYLDRQGLDSDGALYKFVQRSNLDPVFADVTTGVEKKTRLDEGLDDLRTVVDGLNLPTQLERGYSVFDNFDLARTLNYLAVRSITLDADDVRKNFYLYRDTEGNGQWSVLPWDKDWTFGVRGDGGTFLEHPFFGDEAHRKDNANQWNRLYDAVFNDPVLSEMYLRRLRTLMDELLQAPGTENGIFEQLTDSIAAQLEGDLNVNTSSIKSYLTDRRNTLFNEHVVDPLAGEIKELIPEFTSSQYFVPTNNDLGQTWTTVDGPANLDSWLTGDTGVGFNDRFAAELRSEITPLDSCPTCTSLYLRIPFNVDDASAISRMTLQMKYDDGFIAYINGQEVAQVNLVGDISFDMDARAHSNTAARSFENFNISQFTDALRDGENVLAIQVVNSSPTSNDLLVLPRLVDGVVSDAEAAGIPFAQEGNPAITFGAVEHNPVGGQEQEFIELKNENDTAVDISGWRVEGGVNHVFPAGTVVAAGRSLYISPSVPGFMGRTEGPTGGQGLFVQGNYDGHLSNFGETITLIARDEAVMDTFTTPVTPSETQLYLAVTEVHYNPPGNVETTEFIEIANTSDSVTLDLTGVTLSSGPSEPYQVPDATMLGPGETLVIAKDRDALLAAYPAVDASRVVGGFVGNLSNGGERIKLDDANGSTVAEFRFDDEAPWSPDADGTGNSLTRVSVVSDEDDPANWIAATPTPGSLDGAPDNDLNQDGVTDASDIDFLCGRLGAGDVDFDFNGDGLVNDDDLVLFVEGRLGSLYGDANLDRVFDSRDLVEIFQAGQFENEVQGDSTWATGDWDCDGDFTTSDLVRAFQTGGYVAGARGNQPAAQTQLSPRSTLIAAALPHKTNDVEANLGRNEKTNLMAELPRETGRRIPSQLASASSVFGGDERVVKATDSENGTDAVAIDTLTSNSLEEDK